MNVGIQGNWLFDLPVAWGTWKLNFKEKGSSLLISRLRAWFWCINAAWSPYYLTHSLGDTSGPCQVVRSKALAMRQLKVWILVPETAVNENLFFGVFGADVVGILKCEVNPWCSVCWSHMCNISWSKSVREGLITCDQWKSAILVVAI